MIKIIISFIAWLIGAYTVLFASALYLHINESNVIAHRADALLPKITRDDKSGLVKVAVVQNMKQPSKPRFWEPHTLLDSLFGERQTDQSINRILGRAIERVKDDLNGKNLGPVDLRGANLKGANLGFVNLKASVLVNADLSNAALHKTDISNADLQ